MIGSAIFLVIAPGIVAGYVPWRICRWRAEAPLLGISWFRYVGLLFIAAGLAILLDSFGRFALQGLGTPAPVFPTRYLIVSGLFRYVRNPMYVAVVSLVLGQGLFSAASAFLNTASQFGRHSICLFSFMKSLRCGKLMGLSTSDSARTSQDGFRVSDLGSVSANRTKSGESESNLAREGDRFFPSFHWRLAVLTDAAKSPAERH
jgi:Phospholipid methyltransferase